MRYRFLWSPRWIIGHLIVIALAITMVELGFWQLRRRDEKVDRRAVLRTELVADPVPLAQTPDPARYQRVSLDGQWSGTSYLIANRSYQGQSGYEVVTPFALDGGTSALVDRGWIPLTPSVDHLPPIEPPTAGPVHLVGIVDHQPGDAVIWDTGASADRRFVRGRLPSNTTIQLQSQDPALAPGQPILLPDPDSSLGPHLSYALQWFTFTAMLLIFYPLLARRSAQNREKEARQAAADAADGSDGGHLGSPAGAPGLGGLQLPGQPEQAVLLTEAPGELHADR